MNPERPHDGAVIDGEVENPTDIDVYREPAVPSHPLDADPKQFAMQVQRRGDNYAMLVAWLVDNLDPDADVMQVHVVSRQKCRRGGPPNCSPSVEPRHWSDPDLSRAGVEKVCGLLGLGARYLGMQDFRRQALKGVRITDVIIDCELYASSDGPAVSQGTGACNIDEVKGSLNSCMKRAAKRSKADALKSCAGLSGLATELKKRMTPKDPDKVANGAKRDQERARHTGEGQNRWNTGAVLTHWPIGEAHKGKLLRELPTQYLDWFVNQPDSKNMPDCLRAAAGELSKRRDADGSSSTGPPPSPAPPPESFEPFDDEIPF